MSLKERRDIAHLYGHTPRGVLFTLVEMRGSSSHAAGARFYAAADGRSAGSVSSGWIETELLQRAELLAGADAQMQIVCTAPDVEAHLLIEFSDTPEAAALMETFEATLRGESRSVVTVLPKAGTALLRFVMDAQGDVLFASDLLETEEIVPMRRTARSSAHGALHMLAQGRIFVEHIEPTVSEQDTMNNTLHTEAR
ncbi:XdhC family protein [Terriglobus sp. RCC_193]|uniref:XdhC family protein n=1 Tax=Terriglobus sp. RCC_193 TaxID=3239218 RepID=UPI003525CD4E